MIAYKIISRFYWLIVRLAAFLGHAKAARSIGYRNKQLPVFQKQKAVIWIHAASAGEGNQVLNLIPHLRKIFNAEITISFFSPSGYDFHADNPLFDHVIMLPAGIGEQADQFVESLDPLMAIFVRNELWYDYLKALRSKNIPAFLINAPEHLLSNPPFYLAKYIDHCLDCFTTVFPSGHTPSSRDNVHPLSGNTKWETAPGHRIEENNRLSAFTDHRPCIVIGSSWKAEERMVRRWIDRCRPDARFILVPHESNTQRILELESMFPGSVRYSDLDEESMPAGLSVLILDEYGLLKTAYKYADVALVGGGFGKGIHNILEPASAGLPVVFGPRHAKFPEAGKLILADCAFSCSDQEEFDKVLSRLVSDPEERARIKERTAGLFVSMRGHSEKLAEAMRSMVNP